MKIIKRNQVIVYVAAFMLVVAGYLSYSNKNNVTETSSNIGDAQLVSTESTESNLVVNEVFLENEVESNNKAEDKTNLSKEKKNNKGNEENNNDDYFSISKLERDTMYSQMIETYEKILNSTNASKTHQHTAQEEIRKINNIKNSIMICENLIKTKGFKNCIIFVNGKSVSIIIDDEKLSTEEISQIQNIISRELKANPENIHISNK